MPKYYATEIYDDCDKGKRNPEALGIKGKALAEWRKDNIEISQGRLQPKFDFIFVWDAESGERKLFRGVIDLP